MAAGARQPATATADASHTPPRPHRHLAEEPQPIDFVWLVGYPSMAVFSGRLYVAYRNTDDGLAYYVGSSDGRNRDAPAQIIGTAADFPYPTVALQRYMWIAAIFTFG